MNDKERLQTIKDQFEWGEENLESGIYNLESDDVKWLIEQVKQLNKDKLYYKNLHMKTTKELVKFMLKYLELQKIIERYEKALWKIIDESICKGVDCDFGDNCYAVIARKALDGEEL